MRSRCSLRANGRSRPRPTGWAIASNGPKLSHPKGHNIVSDGTVNGSIQVPGSGQPIVLMRDRGTTGGYPKIATVIGPDLGILAQRRAGQSVRFAEIGIEEAEGEARRFAELIKSLPGQSAGRRVRSEPRGAARRQSCGPRGQCIRRGDVADFAAGGELQAKANDDGDNRS